MDLLKEGSKERRAMEAEEDKSPLMDEVGLETPSEMMSKEVDECARIEIGGAALTILDRGPASVLSLFTNINDNNTIVHNNISCPQAFFILYNLNIVPCTWQMKG